MWLHSPLNEPALQRLLQLWVSLRNTPLHYNSPSLPLLFLLPSLFLAQQYLEASLTNHLQWQRYKLNLQASRTLHHSHETNYKPLLTPASEQRWNCGILSHITNTQLSTQTQPVCLQPSWDWQTTTLLYNSCPPFHNFSTGRGKNKPRGLNKGGK